MCELKYNTTELNFAAVLLTCEIPSTVRGITGLGVFLNMVLRRIFRYNRAGGEASSKEVYNENLPKLKSFATYDNIQINEDDAKGNKYLRVSV
jgi:hypothetical protein